MECTQLAFEQKVEKNLEQLGVKLCSENNTPRIGAAVSGGADSLSLLISLCHILKKYNLPLFVININHNIRSEEESGGDSDFVRERCKKLAADGFDVVFECAELERGSVEKLSKEREGGVEEAARYLRYQAFDNFIAKHSLDVLCLAHNQNDQLETVLMRFLQGSGVENTGIAPKREKFIRPLLNISRDEIEKYLNSLSESWRNDSTNEDDSYLRNNIRLNLIPLLNEKFAGWKTALLTGIEKNQLDKEIIQDCLNEIKIEYKDEKALIKTCDFISAARGLKIRALIKACNLVSGENESGRIPFNFLKDVCSEFERCGRDVPVFFESKVYKNIEISCKNECIIVKKSLKEQTDFAFSVIIEEEGIFDFHFGKLSFVHSPDGCNQGVYDVFLNEKKTAEKIKLPVLVRSYLPSDVCKCMDGEMKKLNDIFSSWKVPQIKRSQIPVLQELTDEAQRIVCILGGALGFDNWIVK